MKIYFIDELSKTIRDRRLDKAVERSRTRHDVSCKGFDIEYHDGYMECMDKRDGRTLRYITNERNYR